MSGPRQRLGMFGGAFDPPHNAHVTLAGVAVDQLALDELRIFPTGQAWHKARPLSPSVHRLAMARLAFQGLPRVVVDPRELEREGPTYTVDTLFEIFSHGFLLGVEMGRDGHMMDLSNSEIKQRSRHKFEALLAEMNQ